MLVDASGTELARYLYDSFGNTLGMWGTLAAGNTYRFSGKEYDLHSGLYYFGYRFYDPNLQRWLNQDPLGEAGGINLYGFVGNSPINAMKVGMQINTGPLLTGGRRIYLKIQC
jgi:RHS repeat-associated protein